VFVRTSTTHPVMGDVPPGYENVPPGFEETETAPPGLESAEPTSVPDEAPGFDGSVPMAEGASPRKRTPGKHDLYKSDLTFSDLHLPQEILDALIIDMNFQRPSRIQAITLPQVLSAPDRHMIAQGHNGCGKTTCFTLAMLMRCGVHSLGGLAR
jgi:hypothetical protein